MKSYLVGMGAVVAALTVAPAAYAAEMNTYNPGSPQFQVTFAADGSISANIGRSGITQDFVDTFSFDLLTNGLGSGTVSANFTSNTGNFVRLDTVTINGVPITIIHNGNSSFVGGDSISLATGPNNIVITGTASGNVAYGGSITFVPNAVPEPATWAMMLVGFGMVGSAMRYRRRSTKVVYA